MYTYVYDIMACQWKLDLKTDTKVANITCVPCVMSYLKKKILRQAKKPKIDNSYYVGLMPILFCVGLIILFA